MMLPPANSTSIQSECGKIRTRKTPKTDTFHAVSTSFHWLQLWQNTRKTGYELGKHKARSFPFTKARKLSKLKKYI